MLRCGFLPLRIETGHYIGEKGEQILCRYCTSKSVEGEINFVLRCSFYNHAVS